MDPDFDPDQQQIIRGLLERYFNAIDRRDFDLLATCFTQDVTFEFNLDTKIMVLGRDAVVSRMSELQRPKSSNHALSNTSIVVDGEEARATTFAVVHVVTTDPSGRILVRGIRYDDRLVRVEDRWRIAERRHNPLWQYETVAALTQY